MSVALGLGACNGDPPTAASNATSPAPATSESPAPTPVTGEPVSTTATAAPVLTVGAPAHGAYVAGAVVVSGTVRSHAALASLEAIYNGGSGVVRRYVAVETGADRDAAWSFSIPAPGADAEAIAEGRQAITIVAVDRAGQGAQLTLVVNVDNVAPTVLITSPEGHGATATAASDYIDVAGQVYDPSPLASIQVDIRNPDGAVLGTRILDGAAAWSARFTFGQADGDIPVSSLTPNASYDIVVKAVDAAGNGSSWMYDVSDIAGLLPSPTAAAPTLSAIGVLDQTGGGGPGVAFTYDQLRAIRLGVGQSSNLDFVFDPGSGKPQITSDTLNSATADGNVLRPTQTIDFTVRPGKSKRQVDGASIRAKYRPAASLEWIAVDPSQISVSDLNGVYVCRATPTGPSGNLADGTFWIDIHAETIGGEDQQDFTRSFVVDSVSPNAPIITTPAPGNWIPRLVYTVYGTRSADTATVYVWLGCPGVSPPADPRSWGVATGTNAWSKIFDLSEYAEGECVVEAVAEDAAGNLSTVASRSFFNDSAAPDLSDVNLPSATHFTNRAFALTAQATDGDALARVTVVQQQPGSAGISLLDAAVSEPAYAINVAGLPRDPNKPAASTLADGTYQYVVTATDVAGRSSTFTRTVVLDTMSPLLTIKSPAAGRWVDSPCSFSGTVTDAAGAGVASLEWSFDGVVWNALSAVGANWTVSADLGPGGEGARALYVRASDGLNPVAKAQVAFSYKVREYQWTQIIGAAAFAPRDGAGALVFNDKMWLLGGWNSTDKVHFPRITSNDVWSSQDGLVWTPEKPNGFLTQDFDPTLDWEGRHTAGYVVFNGKMWIIGGDPIQGHYQYDVWNSDDGVHWTWVNPDDPLPWNPRVLFYTVVFDGKIWILGGQTLPAFAGGNEVFYSDIWNSSDGIHWTHITPAQPSWDARGMIGGSAVFQGRMWILGGGTYDTTTAEQRHYYDDIWSSADGVNWTKSPGSGSWPGRQYHSVAVYDDKLWVLAGYNNGNMNDVWYSADGTNWIELPNTPWAVRHATSVYAHAGSLWVVTGNNMRSDVWRMDRVP